MSCELILLVKSKKILTDKVQLMGTAGEVVVANVVATARHPPVATFTDSNLN